MSDLRIKCSVVSRVNIILQIEFAITEITDYKIAIENLLKVIELSRYYKGFTIPTEEAIEPETDEEFQFAAACYLKFETHKEAIKFVECIDPTNFN